MKSRKVTQVEGALVEADLAALRSRVTEFSYACESLKDWQELGARLGYKAQWAWFRWQHSTARKRARSATVDTAS